MSHTRGRWHPAVAYIVLIFKPPFCLFTHFLLMQATLHPSSRSFSLLPLHSDPITPVNKCIKQNMHSSRSSHIILIYTALSLVFQILAALNGFVKYERSLNASSCLVPGTHLDTPLLTVICPNQLVFEMSRHDPPIRTLDVFTNTTLHLMCTGSRELKWKFSPKYGVSTMKKATID